MRVAANPEKLLCGTSVKIRMNMDVGIHHTKIVETRKSPWQYYQGTSTIMRNLSSTDAMVLSPTQLSDTNVVLLCSIRLTQFHAL